MIRTIIFINGREMLFFWDSMFFPSASPLWTIYQGLMKKKKKEYLRHQFNTPSKLSSSLLKYKMEKSLFKLCSPSLSDNLRKRENKCFMERLSFILKFVVVVKELQRYLAILRVHLFNDHRKFLFPRRVVHYNMWSR